MSVNLNRPTTYYISPAQARDLVVATGWSAQQAAAAMTEIEYADHMGAELWVEVSKHIAIVWRPAAMGAARVCRLYTRRAADWLEAHGVERSYQCLS